MVASARLEVSLAPVVLAAAITPAGGGEAAPQCCLVLESISLLGTVKTSEVAVGPGATAAAQPRWRAYVPGIGL